MDMDRRSFLKTLGLVAVALSVPKPLSIVSAKMADLERPPLHVGYCEAEPAHGCGEGGYFGLYNIGVRVERGISLERYLDYDGKWCIAIFMRRAGVQGHGINWLQIPVHFMPNPENKIKAVDEDGREYETNDFLRRPHATALMNGDVLEFWVVPCDMTDPALLPRFHLPKLEVVLCGMKHYGKPRQSVYVPGRDWINPF
jgi:hypothetical protein